MTGSSSGSSSGVGSSSGGSSGSSGSGSGSSSSGGSSGSSSGGSPTSSTGNVTVTAYSYGTPANILNVAGASFSVNAYSSSDVPAIVRHDPATGCVFQQYTGNLAATPVQKSAGVITITGGATSPVTLTPDGTNTYSQFLSSKAPVLFAGGETLTITAAGADVPAFTTALVAPKGVTLTAPASPTIPFVINRAMPLAFTWTPGTLGYVVVAISDNGTATQVESVVCTFAAADGTGTVPSSGLTRLVAGSGSITASVQQSTQVVSGAFTNQIILNTLVLGADGNPTFGGIGATLQ